VHQKIKKGWMNKNLFFVLVFNLLFACSTADREVHIIEKGLIGTWTIDHIWVDDDYELNPIFSNLMTFKKNGKFLFPGSEEIEWKVDRDLNGLLFLNLNGHDNRYNLRLLISFKKDENDKLLKLFLESEQIELIGSKMLFDFDRNFQTINKLTELTGYN
jgi:hypothetical protein